MDLITQIDNRILDFIQANLRFPALDTVMVFITTLGNGGFIWILLSILLLFRKKYRKWGLMLLISLAVSAILGNLTIKPLVARIRPCNVNTDVILLIKRPTAYSFPSGHAMSSFTAAAVLMFANKKIGIVAAVLAILIAFSRLYVYVHYPSDILAGMILGITVAFFVVIPANKFSSFLK